MGKNINRKVTIYINGKEIENTIKSIRAEIRRLENEQKTLPIGSEEYKKKVLEIANLKKILTEQSVTVKNIGESWKSTVESAAEYSNVIMGIQSAFQMFDIAIGKVKDLASDAAKMDDALGMVMKTTGLTHDEVEKLNEEFKKMDTRTSREQLNDLAYQAGKLGYNTSEAVKQFVEGADVINVALGDVLGDDATLEIAKLANVYSQSTDTIEKKDLKGKMLAVGSAVNQLGKESTASEAYMVDFLGRLGGVATQAKLSADQILGYASALDQQKQKLEMSATAFQKLIQQMIKKPQEFLQAARMPLSDFKKLMETDMNEAIKRVLEGFNQMGGLTALVPVFKDMGLDGARAASVVASLASNLDKVNEAQATANEHIILANSMNKEYITMNNTMQAQREKALKAFNETRLALGNELYPVIISIQKSGTVLMKGFAGLIQLLKEYPGIIAPVGAAVLALYKVRLLSAALWLKERPAAIAEWWQRRQNHKAILDETAASAKQRLERANALQQRIKERIAIQESVLARRQELIATGQGNQVLKAEASLRRLKVAQTKADIMATEAATAATKASAAALRTIPLMLFVSALAAVGAKIAEVIKHHRRFKREQQETETAIKSEASAAEYLFKELEKTKQGTEEYKRILGKLNELYPDILKKYDLEKGGLIAIRNARQEVIDKIKEQILEQRKLDKLSDIAGTFGKKQTEALQDMQEYMTRKFGKVKGQVMYEQFASTLPRDYNQKADYTSIRANYERISGEDMGMMYGWNKMLRAVSDYTNAVNEAYDETQNFENLYRGLGAKDNDPYKIAGKSVEELEVEVKRANEQIARLKKLQETAGNQGFGSTDYSRQIGDQMKKVAALKEAIEKLKKEQKSGSSGVDEDNPLVTGGFDEKELKKWSRVKERAERMIADFNAKAESGLLRIRDEVQNKTAQMITAIEEAVGATDAQKQKMIADVQAAARAYEKAKIEAYIKKQSEELNKLRGQLKGSEANEYIGKMEAATSKLAEQVRTIDEAIGQAQADATAAAAAMSGKSEEETKEIQEQISKLNELIASYRVLKEELSASVYNNIVDVSKVQAKPLSGDESQMSEVARAMGEEAQASALHLLYDRSTFEQYIKALDEINKKYEKQRAELEKQSAAENEIIQRLVAQRNNAIETASVENGFNESIISSLDNQIEQHEENAQKIRNEADELNRLNEEAKNAAKEDAFGNAIEKWIAGIEKFGSKAIEIWDNINKVIENNATKAMKNERKAAEDELEERLEQGIVSEEEYNEQKTALDKKYDEKEKAIQLEAWRRQKAINEGQAAMESALAILKAWNSISWPYNAVPVALATAMGIAQVAAIASEPEPYAKGGYVQKRTIYQAGEAGPEWVASNALLQDDETAPVIAALESYQRGNRHALSDITMSRLNVPAAIKASEQIGRQQARAQVFSVARDIERQRQADSSDDGVMVDLLRELVDVSKDPRYRSAILSRRTQEDFEKGETYLRNRAKL